MKEEDDDLALFSDFITHLNELSMSLQDEKLDCLRNILCNSAQVNIKLLRVILRSRCLPCPLLVTGVSPRSYGYLHPTSNDCTMAVPCSCLPECMYVENASQP